MYTKTIKLKESTRKMLNKAKVLILKENPSFNNVSDDIAIYTILEEYLAYRRKEVKA
jgi:hypothetical protein